MNCLWCIDTDEHDACQLASVSDLDGVAVNDSGYWVGGVSEENFGGVGHQGCRCIRGSVDTRCGSVGAWKRSGSATVVVVILACFSVVMPAVCVCASGMRVC